jgi:hypothetical protein
MLRSENKSTSPNSTSGVRVATSQDLPAWQRFVDHMPAAGCMHHAGWFNVLRDAFWVTPYYFIATDGSGNIEGVLPTYHSTSLFTGSYLSSLEDGVLAAHTNAMRAMLREAELLRKRLRARYLQIRGGPISENAPIVVPTVRTVIQTSQPSVSIWRAMKQSGRRGVRKGDHQEIEIEHDADLSEIENFYRVYAEHMRDLGTPVIGLDAFCAIRRYLGPERLRLYLVKYRKRLIGGMLCVTNPNRWTDYYAAVRVSTDTAFANYKLYWHVVCDACSHQVPLLDLGRSTPGSNVHVFKQRWGGYDVDVPYYFYPDPTFRTTDYGLQDLKRNPNLLRRVWSKLPLPLCNRLGPLFRKQLPFV